MPGEPKLFSRRVIRAASIVAVVALGVALLALEGRVLLLLLAGVLFALSLRGVSGWIAKHTRVSYGPVLVAVVLVVIASTLIGTYFFLARGIEQVAAMRQEIPRAWQSLLAAVHGQPELQRLVEPGGGPPKPPPLEIGKLLGGASSALSGLAEALGGVVVVVFIGIYGAAQPSSYPRVVLQLVPHKHRLRVAHVLAETGTQLTSWMLGRVVAMAFVGVVATVGLLILKVPLAVPLGVLAGVLTFIEYLGAIASALPACLLAFTAGPSHVIGVAILYTGAHIIEGYVLTPLLARRTAHFPPAYTLAAQALLGSIFGVAGLTLATPLVIVLTIPVRRLYVDAVLGGPTPDEIDPHPGDSSSSPVRNASQMRPAHAGSNPATR